ncbi:MAG: acetyl-CoA carboxylase biotin carboxylase subunit [Ectothiorhodospiraceae bacterium]|nr:acetyl-CoA carboxylase biotin carboxylase subunit [Ectothiorhodospiraceae bacterium]
MFQTILVANRGEIAARILKTARHMGFRTVAVYSDADAASPHLMLADISICLGKGAASESYLSVERLISAAKQTGADAIHPGYGFLSENAEFAAACAQASITFIGPSPDAISRMGNKATAKRRMLEAGVPCVPGYQEAEADDETLRREAARIGYPIMIKAAAGGGGRGMRLVNDEKAFASALRSARSEASSAFRSDAMILERAISNPRHIEIQVFADRHGNILHLGERDCSIQRRHQKVIEEAPSPAVTPALREKMGEAAIAAAREIGYEGAGTIEFLLDADEHFYFMEMNTRLQVEHPVTEMVTGIDLVEWQIRVAAGEPLPSKQAEINWQGHAIEARLYAEDPTDGFLPQAGVAQLWLPPSGEGIRVDHALASGSEISAYYDPMIAKIICWGGNREEARRKLIRSLEQTVLLGVTTNRNFLADCLEHPEFARGGATTGFIPVHFANGMLRGRPNDQVTRRLGACLIHHSAGSAFADLQNWSNTAAARVPISLAIGDIEENVTIQATGSAKYLVRDTVGESAVHIVSVDGHEVQYELDGIKEFAYFHLNGTKLQLCRQRQYIAMEDRSLALPAYAENEGRSGKVTANTNGTVIAVHVSADQPVKEGDPLLVLEAMKMEHTILAPISGRISRISISVGQQVAGRDLLVELEPA